MKKREFKSSYKKGYIGVGGGHKLYYELYGNPKAAPVLFLHGGPGAGYEEKHKRFFNPRVWNVIFFDQRGAGKSTPFASIKNNTTDDLVSDINKVLDYLKIKKVTIFGGSWGSTLALVYSIKNINRVSRLILYSIFLGREQDEKYLYFGGVKDFFYEDWKRFILHVPASRRDDVIRYYLEQMTCGDQAREDKFAYEWTYYESALMHLRPNYKKIERDLKKYDPKALSILEAHYALNNNFLPDDFILKNAGTLSKIPVSIFHGRYDFVCKPEGAYKLHEKIKGSKLTIVTSGHSGRELEMNRALISEMNSVV